MKVEIDIPDYDPVKGVSIAWDERYVLKSEWHEQDGEFVIVASSEALQELAVHLLTLAQKEVPSGTHLHYDSLNYTTEPDATPFTVMKT